MLYNAKAKISTKYEDFVFYSYKDDKNFEHVTLVKGDVFEKENVFCRLHSACVAGDIFHSSECTCNSELESAMEICEKEKTGLIIWMNHNSISDYINSFDKMTEKKILRDFSFASKILNDLKVKSICLMTKNTEKVKQLKDLGINIVGMY